jgi:predicted Zn-dependent protease
MNMKDNILHLLRTLRAYAVEKGYVIDLVYHEEDSSLMRFANSAISLNTNEHIIRLGVEAYDGRRRAEYSMITSLDDLDGMKRGIDLAVEMAHHAQPLDYDLTVPVFEADFADQSAFDPALAAMSSEERLAFFNQAVAGLEEEELLLSGIFSSGVNIWAQINTLSEHTQYFQTTDAQISVVLAHRRLKWEVTAEQSAQQKSDLNAEALRHELAFLVRCYKERPAIQLPLGSYDIVLGQAAVAELLSMMNWIGFNGGAYKRGFCFLGEEKIGQKVFSELFTLVDDPSRRETFPFRHDFMGIERRPFPLVQNGVFQGFMWMQDDADEFGMKATGHTVPARSLVMSGGDVPVATVEQLTQMPRERDVLYIPFLHYMNIVNPSLGVVTASSRFGALLLKQDGSIMVPYNVRLTHSLLDLFGERVAWISSVTAPYNTSRSYGERNPTAVIVPMFMQVNGMEISHSNSSY